MHLILLLSVINLNMYALKDDSSRMEKRVICRMKPGKTCDIVELLNDSKNLFKISLNGAERSCGVKSGLKMLTHQYAVRFRPLLPCAVSIDRDLEQVLRYLMLEKFLIEAISLQR